MRFVARLIVRILVVATLCLVSVTGWLLLDARRGIDEATASSSERVVSHLQRVYWQRMLWRDGLDRQQLLPDPDWRNLDALRVISPGVCVTFGLGRNGLQTLCNESPNVYPDAPAWFGDLYRAAFGDFPSRQRYLDLRERAGELVVASDPGTALRLAWLQVGLMFKTAILMASALGLLVAVVVAQALIPVRTIVEGLRRLEFGNYAQRIPCRGRQDLGEIANAVNLLSERLERTEAARTKLTRQLFTIQEEERRALARDLHDEFGQCLAATSAFAGSIEAGAPDRPDIVEDARSIASVTERMMRTLREALSRLRSQDIDELGLENCLQGLVAKWNRGGADRAFELEVAGDLMRVPRPVAISLYRIAQECVTNAARHSAARQVRVIVEGPTAENSLVSLVVEDDGGGDLEQFSAKRSGHGLLGIRERIAALGGSFSIDRAAQGIRVAATIPYAQSFGPVGAAA